MLLLPRPLVLGFLVLFAGQLLYHHAGRAQMAANYQALDKPLSAAVYRGLAMGSEQLLGYLLALRLQLHDNQAGQHFRYSLIDYDILIDWLELISAISPHNEYAKLGTSDKERASAYRALFKQKINSEELTNKQQKQLTNKQTTTTNNN